MSWPHTAYDRVVRLLSSSVPWAAQDLGRGLEGQAAEEDAGHEGEPGAGLRCQVGLRKGPVEVRTVPPVAGFVSCRPPEPSSCGARRLRTVLLYLLVVI